MLTPAAEATHLASHCVTSFFSHPPGGQLGYGVSVGHKRQKLIDRTDEASINRWVDRSQKSYPLPRFTATHRLGTRKDRSLEGPGPISR